jgi:hypothetical protein
MDIGARPHVYGVFLISVLTLADDLCCMVYISCLVLVPGDKG